MDVATRELVRRRAGDRCEYCGAIEGLRARIRFHVEHIVARQHGGGDSADNLALACHLCNAHKGPNLSGIDPATGHVALLFHPRRERWADHFTRVGGEIVGRTETGRATVAVLDMNHPARTAARLRSEL
jgi:5-methylcytosine-specific restriction endonuclease McrA